MASVCFRAWPVGVVALLILAGPGRADDTAETELKELQRRVEANAGDPIKLREDLLKYRRYYPGTTYSVRAAELLSQVPSPLDKLDPASIPEPERFDWHPRELVAVLGESRGRQAGDVTAVGYSPDGKLLVSGGSNGVVRLWDPATLRQKQALGVGYGATCLVFSKDGKNLVVGNNQGYVYSWDMTGDAPKASPAFRAATTSLSGISLSPGGKLLAAGSADSVVHVFELTEKEPKEKIQLTGHTAAVNGVAYAPDGKTLVSVGADMSLRLWEPGGDQASARAVVDGAHKAAINCVGFSPADARVLATGAADGSIKVWDLSGTKPREKAEVTTKSALHALTYTVTGKTLATAHTDGSVHFWDAGFNPPKEKFTLEGHASGVACLAFAPGGRDLATGGLDWTVRTWNLAATPKPKQYAEPKGHLSHVYTSAFSPDDATLATGSYDHMVRTWALSAAAPKEKATLTGDPWPVYTVAYSPDGKMIASGGQGTTIRLWNAVKMDALRQIKPNPGSVNSLTFTPDSKMVLAATGNTVVVWDAATTDQVRILEGHESPVHSVAVSPDGKKAVTGSGTYLYKDGKIVIENGKYVYVDPTLRVFNIESGKAVHAVKSYAQPVSHVAFAPDGRTVLSTTNEAKVWHLDVSAEPKEVDPVLKAASGYIRLPVFSPDGKKVATLGAEASVVIWEAATGKVLHRFSIPENVGHVSFANDSRHLAVTAATGVVYVLRLSGPAK
jgi:WD40 repeat protein